MRVLSILVLLLLAPVSFATEAQDRFVCQSNGSELHQLRIYELNRSNKDAFHRRFQDHALRIMKRHGFRIIDMWESDNGKKVEFVYLLSWPDKATMDSRWKAFLADQEWIDTKRKSVAESGELVGEVSSRSMTRVSYSPACSRQ